MADNPFDAFDAKPANPFDAFDAKSAPPAAPSGQSAQPGWTDYLLQHLAGGTSLNPNAPGKPLGQTAFWNKPADASWSDYAAAHFQPIDDIVRHATNVAGVGDRVAAGMSNLTGIGGGDLAAQRAQSATADARMPGQNKLAADIMGYAPLAAQGIATGLGGGVLGSGAEMATAGVLANAGNSNAKTWGGMGGDALIGGTVGGVTGLGVGAAGKYVLNPIVNAVANKVGSITGALSKPTDITATAKAAKEKIYDALKPIPADVTDAAANARSAVEAHDPGNSLQPNAPRTMAVLNRIDKSLKPGADQSLSGQDAMDYLMNQRGKMAPDDYRAAMNDLVTNGKMTIPGSSKPSSASDLRTWLDELRDVQGPTAGAENELAPIVEQHLNDAVNASGARGLFDQAAAAHKVYKNAQFLQQGREGLKYFGQSPSGEAARIAQTYYPTGAADLEAGLPTPAAAAYKRLSDIATAGGGMPSGYSLAHAVHPLARAVGSGFGAMVGGPAGAVIGDTVGGAMGAGVKTGLSNAMSAAQRRATQSALTAAYPDLTGQSIRFPDMNLSPALRAIVFGWGSPYFHPK
jgi:hypothetical protein